MTTTELIGYVASLLVAISMMMTSILRLRLLNLVGSTTFAIYGLLIQAYPVAAVNFFIACVQIYYITRMLRRREFFTIVNVVPDSDYLRFFLEQNMADIRRFMPGYEYRPAPNQLTIFVVRDLQPAGLMIGELRDGVLHVSIDYVIPGYRDLRVGQYLLQERADFFRDRGVRRIVAKGDTAAHAGYLERMGFVRTDGDAFAKEIA